MLVFPGMIAEAARKAGMKVPPDPEDFDANEFPHFQVFCITQLSRPVRHGEHWENAHVIAAVPEEQIKTISFDDLIDRGLEWRN